MSGLKIALCGQKYFGQEVLKALVAAGHEVVLVSAPPVGERGLPDRLFNLARKHDLNLIQAGNLRAANMPGGIDLIVCAHAHDFISRSVRAKTTYGAIGYHPSLLPLHRGRDAVYWALRMGDKITGGSVYWLNEVVDGGPIAAQGWCFIRPGDTPSTLWQRELQPMGVALLLKVIADIGRGVIIREQQDEALATWEPGVGRPPLFRPDLLQIGDGVSVKINRWGANKSQYDEDVLVQKFGFK